jgi:NitT/TauT family transport system ATP-binding protein
VLAEPVAADVLRLSRVSKTFVSRGARVEAVSDIDLRVGDGELVTIVGASGCGKSTLLNLMVGLQQPTAGQVLFRGRPVAGPVPQLAYVTQKDTLLPWRTLQRNVEFPLEIRKVDRATRAARGLALIEQVGLGGFEDHYPHELSGGMRQRAMIVRSLVSDPEVLLLDEPFGALDAQTRGHLQDQLMALQAATGKTMVFVTHDLMEAVILADRVVVVSSRPGRIMAEYEVPIPRPRSAFEVHRVPLFWKIFEAVKDKILGQPGAAG